MVDKEEKTNLEEESTAQETVTKKIKRQMPPALTITFQSWATPILALVMLVVGVLGGYFLRTARSPSQTAAVVDSSSALQATQVRPTVDPTASKQLMDYLVAQVKHFQGDANAPVTIIEFSDFQ